MEKLAAWSSAPFRAATSRRDPGQRPSPAGRAGHGGNPGLDQPLQIGDDRIGPGELDRDVHSGCSRSAVSATPPAFSSRPMTRDGMATLRASAATACPILPLPTIMICIRWIGLGYENRVSQRSVAEELADDHVR